MSEELLALKGLCKYYTSGSSVVMGLNHVDLAFRSGEFVAITGESGSGKSTLAHVIGGIVPYESGEMYLEGKPTSHYDSGNWERHRRERISFISQNYGILTGSSVLTNVISALRISGMEPNDAVSRAEELLKMVELWELRDRRAAKLSSGQKQRLSIARALAKPAPILIADEPTGNLDPENSAKVMQLLAQAAAERLVILITHDFQEAEAYATRRIALQDGRITQDTVLGPSVCVKTKSDLPRKDKPLSGYVSRLQIMGRPVWSGLMGLLFTLTAFAVFAFLGTFIVNLDDTSTRIYDDSAFLNGDKSRIVVQRSDLAPMTQEDWETLLSVDHVRELERSGYLVDWVYAYREGVDFSYHYSVETRGGDTNTFTISKKLVKFLEPMFIRTVPLLTQDKEFLTAGRLPENMYEVVMAGGSELLGSTMPVYISDLNGWGTGSYIQLDVTVVGVTDYGTGIYFADELGRVVNNYVVGGSLDNGMHLIMPVYGEFATLNGKVLTDDYLTEGRLPQKPGEIVLPQDICPLDTYLPTLDMTVVGQTRWGAGMFVDQEIREEWLSDSDLSQQERDALETLRNELLFRVRYPDSDNQVLADMYLYDGMVCAMSETLYKRAKPAADRYETRIETTWVPDFSAAGTQAADPDTWIRLQAVGYHTSSFIGQLSVTPELFDRLALKGNANQVSLYISDYAYTDAVLEELRDHGYLAISVFRQGSTQKNPALVKQRMQTLGICLAALAAVVLLQVLVLKELFGVQIPGYKLLADMGLGRLTAQRSILWQVMVFTLLGQTVGFLGIRIFGGLGVERIAGILRYLPAGNWAILSLVHLAASAVTALLAIRTMKKKVYPQSAAAPDLALDEEVRL